MFEKLFQWGREPKKSELKPFNWNFENGVVLRGRMADSKPELQFVRDNEVLFDLGSLLPPNITLRFDPQRKWAFDDRNPEKMEVIFGNFETLEDLLKFIHEIGHSYDLEAIAQWRDAREISHEEKLKDKDCAFPLSRLKAIQKYWDLDRQIERFAWDFVAKTIAELEKTMGINIQGKLAESKSLEEFVGKILKDIEKEFLNELYDVDIHSRQGLDLAVQLAEEAAARKK